MNLMPRINYDTLLEVMWMCPRDDCARFMQTCRFLRNSGYCVLLSHPLHFHEEKEVLRLLEYLQLQNDWRSRHVRSMHFDMGAVELSESTALALAAALPRMHGLQELSISDSEYFLSSNQDLFHATGALTSLRSLHLTDMGEFAVEMLRSLQSELVNILLDFDVDTSFEDSEEELVCLPDLLAHSQATLQEVAIHRWYHLPDTRASDEPTTVKFPATRRLLLGQPLHPPLAVSYMRSFPTLSRLTLGTGESEMPDVEGVRKLNITDQGEPSCTWKALDELDGNLIDIYALALPCTVEQVHLGEVTLDTLHMVGPVLSNARPRRLYMDNWPVGKAQDPALDAFVAFRGQGGSRLEVLTMEVRLSNSNSDVDVATVLVRTRFFQAANDEPNPVGHRRKNCLPPLRRVRPYKSCDWTSDSRRLIHGRRRLSRARYPNAPGGSVGTPSPTSKSTLSLLRSNRPSTSTRGTTCAASLQLCLRCEWST